MKITKLDILLFVVVLSLLDIISRLLAIGVYGNEYDSFAFWYSIGGMPKVVEIMVIPWVITYFILIGIHELICHSARKRRVRNKNRR